MRRAFLLGAAGLVLHEALCVYFIMPFPGSQRIPSLEAAYLLYRGRWVARALCALLIGAGLPDAWRARAWRLGFVPALALLAGGVTYAVNFMLAADAQFLQPLVVRMVPAAANTVARDRLVVGIEVDGEARAYPLQFIGYHHQVRDTVAGRPVLVSYCTVCRTGRVFSPVVNGRVEQFRLVGMDRFNAMLEDATTGSWWRQANGEAVAGPLRGATLAELPSRQVTLATWLVLYPHTRIMQADSAFLGEYAKDYAYERGTSRKQLTGTDTASWHDKSWVVGITLGGASTAFDWNRLERERVINAEVGGTPVVLALAADSASFFAFERPDRATTFALRGDSLVADAAAYAFNGKGPAGALRPVNASQEFWHSWRTFQPRTARY
ncbi:MAG: DUF3179 domain-containing protein [Gemmatimonadetes bacterium]|nr:DUF3179 domain-containing protein [Gemmatimonadota bacterium]